MQHEICFKVQPLVACVIKKIGYCLHEKLYPPAGKFLLFYLKRFFVHDVLKKYHNTFTYVTMYYSEIS